MTAHRLAALMVLAPMAGGRTLQAQAAAADPLIGVWASETTFGPLVRGELTVVRETAGWNATIAGLEVAFPVNRDSVRFALAGGLGEFRGVRSRDGSEIAGFWVQPAGVTLSQPYASPVTLRRLGPDIWRGTIVPLDDRFSLYLTVSRRADGSLQGVFRNPELNSYGRWLRFRVTRDGDSVHFIVRPDDDEREIRLAATVDSSRRQLTIWWPDLGRPLVLIPRTPEQAVGLYPRLPRGQAYRYRPPPALADGWRTGRASEVGLDEAALARLVQGIVDTEPTLIRAPLIHSLLVARHGRLVLEEYFYGFDRHRPHDSRSAGKTFASVMVGAAMMQGAPITPETSAYALLAAVGPFANADPRKARITVGQLMTHSSGLACDDNEEASPGNEDVMQAQQAQPDWWRYTLDLPLVFDPGTHYAYCSGGMSLVGGALTAATGVWLPAFFERTIARPLAFGPYHFNLMPTLEGYQGGGVQLLPRDLLKLGQAYLNGGTWNGRRLVTSEWVTRSTAPQLEHESRGMNVPAGVDGFAWHLNTVRSGDRTYREYEATGNGGQLLIVLPELDLVVVFTAGNYGFGGVWGKFRDELVARVLIPAIRDR